MPIGGFARPCAGQWATVSADPHSGVYVFSDGAVVRSRRALTVALGHPPTAVEMAQHLAMPVERVERR